MADVLRKIKQAEQDAEKQLADAQAEVGKIAAEARRQSVQLVADATDGSVSETQATLDAARAKANKEAEGVAKEGQKVVDAHRIFCSRSQGQGSRPLARKSKFSVSCSHVRNRRNVPPHRGGSRR